VRWENNGRAHRDRNCLVFAISEFHSDWAGARGGEELTSDLRTVDHLSFLNTEPPVTVHSLMINILPFIGVFALANLEPFQNSAVH
jgi:hypothetical protein